MTTDGRRDRWQKTLTILSVAAALAYVWPLWRDLTSWGGTFDWGYFFFLSEVDRITVTQYGQFPLWNPYYCGGSVHLASPQSYFLSPTFLFIALFGTPVGLRLTLTAAIVLAVDGTRRFLRACGIGPLGTFVGALGYAFSGTMAQHLGGGHVGWVGFCVFPYVLHSFIKASRGERRHVLYGGLFLAWIFGHFGGYTFPYSVLGLGVFALCSAASTGRWRVSVASSAGMVVFALGLSAIRLLPVLEFMQGHPRLRPDVDVVLPRELFEIYAVHRTQRAVFGHPYVWPEYGNYLGVPALVLVAAGAWVAIRRRRDLVPLLAATATFLVFQIGNVTGFPWWLLKHLPVFRFMRAPSRFTILVGFFACGLVALAVDRLADRPVAARLGGRAATALPSQPGGGPRRGRAALATVVATLTMLVAVGFLIDEAVFNNGQWFQTMAAPPPTEPVAAQFRQVRGDRRRMYAFPRSNRGTLDCFEEAPLDISPGLRADLPADEYAADPTVGRVRRLSWSPNRIVVEADFRQPGVVVVNQNFHAGWRADGGDVMSQRGLLAARVPAGRTAVTFRYLPTSFLIGLGITMLTLGYGVWLWGRFAGSRPAAPR